ncbi:MAG: DUF418 domain-containing protein [Deltaproteobacteria bacterium]|nr:MAG: DUF418 domain-containing protein [Deltaproteobacteria bacterium]
MESSSKSSNRMIGIDVARAIALLGMVWVNYKLKLDSSDRGLDGLVWLLYRFEGRSAALFVVLAGVGISLRSRRALEDPAAHAAFERSALLKRASILFVVGLLNLHMWEWDILHCYGVYLAFAALLLTVRSSRLVATGVGIVLVSVVLQFVFNYETSLPLWTPMGMIADMFFNGVHPFFSWGAFLVLGMWLGRMDLREHETCRRVLILGLLAATLGETVDTLAGRGLLGLSKETAAWLSAWPRPPRPGYIVAAGGTALAIIALCVSFFRERSEKKWVVALGATGQLAFTLYIVHIIAILIPLQHGLLKNASLAVTVLYGSAFFVVAVAGSVWWRRRFAYGPIEGLIRQITGRTTPAPWGGEPLAK